MREMIRSMSYSRYFRIPTPMDTGSAAKPRISYLPEREALLPNEAMTEIPQTAAPLVSHLSCWRRSPEDRRQLAICRPRSATSQPARSAAEKDLGEHVDNRRRRVLHLGELAV